MKTLSALVILFGLAPALSNAASVTGGFSIFTFGTGGDYDPTASTFNFGATPAIYSANTDFSGIANGTSIAVSQPLSWTGYSTSPVADNISDFLSFGSYQFDLTSLQVTAPSSTYPYIQGFGILRDTSGIYSSAVADFTISMSGAVGGSDPLAVNYAASFYAAPVPLPATVWLMLSGLGGIAVVRGKRRAPFA